MWGADAHADARVSRQNACAPGSRAGAKGQQRAARARRLRAWSGRAVGVEGRTLLTSRPVLASYHGAVTPHPAL